MAKDEPQLIFKTEEAKWAWLAGLIDGEGDISITKNRYKDSHKTKRYVKRGFSYRVRIRITNTNTQFLEEAQKVAGCGYVYGHVQNSKRAKNWKDGFQLSFGIEATRKILPKILPFLIIKRKRAELVLKALEYFKGRGHGANPEYFIEPFYQEIKCLNHKGRGNIWIS